MLFAVDSNVMIYAEGADDPRRRDIAVALLSRVGMANLLIPLQAAGETFLWLVRKGRLSRAEAATRISFWLDACALQDTNRAVFEAARDLVKDHGLQVWDAIIVAAASVGGASILLSEDMQDGFHWGDLVIINPFSTKSPAIIQLLLGGDSS